MIRRKPVAFALVLAGAVAVAAAVAWPEDEAPGAPETGGGAAEVLPRAAIEPATARGPAQPEPEARSEPAVKKLRLPDGTEVEPLNGVREPAAIVWHSGPWSPIRRVVHHHGVDWFEHEDGSHSTTVMVWRDVLNRLDAATIVSRPGEPSPIETGEITPVVRGR